MWFWRWINWWRLAQAAMFSILLAVFVLPDTVAAHGNLSNDVSATITPSLGLDVSHEQAIEQTGHCHPGLDCSVQAVFVFRNIAEDPQSQQVPRYSKYMSSFLSWRPDFDPPPPRTLP